MPDPDGFGSFQLPARLVLTLSGHDSPTGYRRRLDLDGGHVGVSYEVDGATCRREVYVSHPDDVLVLHLPRTGGGYTGSFALHGTHGETTTGASGTVSFAGAFDNGVEYAAAAGATGTGTVGLTGGTITFTDCTEVLIVVAGGTNYAPTHATGYRSTVDPRARSVDKVRRALASGASALRAAHLTDYQVDANLGAPAAMLEMLVYSRRGLVELLPALPSAWASGSARGLGVRGGFTLDVDWSDGRVTSATLHSVGGTRTVVRSGTWRREVVLRPGRSTALAVR